MTSEGSAARLREVREERTHQSWRRQCPRARTITVEANNIPVADAAGSVKVRIMANDEGCERKCTRYAVAYIHGGGFCFGSCDQQDWKLERLVATTGCSVISIGYRLAPEHTLSECVQDVVAAFCWLHSADGKAALGLCNEVEFIGIGESAGAYLLAKSAMLFHELNSRVCCAFLVFLYGWFNLRNFTPSALSCQTDDTLAFSHLTYFSSAALGRLPHAKVDLIEDAEALRRSLGGSCRVLLTVGDKDPLQDDSVLLHAALGNDVADLKVYPGGTHACFCPVQPNPVGEEMTQDVLAWIKQKTL